MCASASLPYLSPRIRGRNRESYDFPPSNAHEQNCGTAQSLPNKVRVSKSSKISDEKIDYFIYQVTALKKQFEAQQKDFPKEVPALCQQCQGPVGQSTSKSVRPLLPPAIHVLFPVGHKGKYTPPANYVAPKTLETQQKNPLATTARKSGTAGNKSVGMLQTSNARNTTQEPGKMPDVTTLPGLVKPGNRRPRLSHVPLPNVIKKAETSPEDDLRDYYRSLWIKAERDDIDALKCRYGVAEALRIVVEEGFPSQPYINQLKQVFKRETGQNLTRRPKVKPVLPKLFDCSKKCVNRPTTQVISTIPPAESPKETPMYSNTKDLINTTLSNIDFDEVNRSIGKITLLPTKKPEQKESKPEEAEENPPVETTTAK